MTSRRMLAGIALGILLLTINASTAFVRMRDVDEYNRRVAHTHRVLATLEETHSLLQAAEAGKHRFLLVADPVHLVPVRIAITTIGDKLTQLRAMTSDNPRHQARLDQIQGLTREKLREYKAATEFREMNLTSIREHLRAQPGRLAMDQIRVLINEMRGEEEDLLSRHGAQSQASLVGARWTLILSSVADFLLVGLACWLVGRDARIRHDSERTLRDHAGAMENANHELSRLCEEAQAATRAKSEFLANMSHEIRTPMTAILGHAELLATGRQSPQEQTNSARAIQRNGEHLLQLINDILDLSKIEAGKLSIERTRVSPLELLGEIRSMMEDRAGSRGLTFHLAFDGPIPKEIESDPTRLRQILFNLVGNAIKFTERGGVRVHCRLEPGPPPTLPRLCIDVVDTGIGIAPDRLEHLFQPFVQADSSTTRRFGGSGLGLYISRCLAEALGGTLEAASQLGAGSRFTLTVPVQSAGQLLDQTADASPKEHGEESFRELTEQMAGRRILLAEDGADNQYLLSHHLRSAGMEVEIVDNGYQAVERTRQADRARQHFDVILMDMQMPGMDGYTAVTRLRQEGYAGRIVALTAHAMEGDRKKCLAVGCDDYLSKPATRAQLLRTVAANLITRQPKPVAVSALKVSLESETQFAPELVQLDSSFAGDPRMTAAIERFVDHLPQRIEALLHAADTGDLKTLVRETHRLKGAAGGYGFQPLTDAAAAFEDTLAHADGDSEVNWTSLRELVDLCRRASAPRHVSTSEKVHAACRPGD